MYKTPSEMSSPLSEDGTSALQTCRVLDGGRPVGDLPDAPRHLALDVKAILAHLAVRLDGRRHGLLQKPKPVSESRRFLERLERNKLLVRTLHRAAITRLH